jgi:hypothetical protein
MSLDKWYFICEKGNMNIVLPGRREVMRKRGSVKMGESRMSVREVFYTDLEIERAEPRERKGKER